MSWRLADARNRFSEVVNRALAGDPQVVLRGRDAVVVVARRDYEKLTGKRVSFKQFLLGKGPSLQGLALKRDRSPMRKVKLGRLHGPSLANSPCLRPSETEEGGRSLPLLTETTHQDKPVKPILWRR